MITFKKINDCDEINNLLVDFEDCFPHLKEKISDYSEFSKKLQKYANVFVANIGLETIGISCFYANDFDFFHGYISLIGIKKEYQSQGYGKELLCFTEQKMLEMKMKTIKLEVDNDNIKSLTFYKLNGFEIDELLQNSLYMKKCLGD